MNDFLSVRRTRKHMVSPLYDFQSFGLLQVFIDLFPLNAVNSFIYLSVYDQRAGDTS